jgi:hypothetical protein
VIRLADEPDGGYRSAAAYEVFQRDSRELHHDNHTITVR